eukprot:TRINITY_DN12337_c0_g1_i1.p1 TRINITY_DN12337_c0_g1~~TRINITY_DN12337_c0_g1_i1.p1  ORF type:complete len:333 (-),score=29.75 TRINITY_DN12337_c0_g1_i1:371-1369(-)
MVNVMMRLPSRPSATFFRSYRPQRFAFVGLPTSTMLRRSYVLASSRGHGRVAESPRGVPKSEMESTSSLVRTPSTEQTIFYGLETPPGGFGRLVLFRQERHLPHFFRQLLFICGGVLFLFFGVNNLFCTEWSPDASLLDWVTGSYSRKNLSADVPDDLYDVSAQDELWIQRRWALRRSMWFGRFTTPQMVVTAVHWTVAAMFFATFRRFAYLWVDELVAIFENHRITKFRVAFAGMRPLFAPEGEIAFADLGGRSSFFDGQYQEMVDAAHRGDGVLIFTIRGRKLPALLAMPSAFGLVHGTVWQPSKIFEIFSRHKLKEPGPITRRLGEGFQ